jgi:hypothetical protein
MNKLPKDVAALLNQIGISEQSVQWIRFGGVVGKMTLIALIGVGGTAVIAIKAQSSALLWGCLCVIGIIAVIALVGVCIHGHNHPLEATLEGGQVVALKQIQHAMATKEISVIPASSPSIEGSTRKELGGANRGGHQLERT